MPAKKRRRRLKVKNIVLALLLVCVLAGVTWVVIYFIQVFQYKYRELNPDNLGISSSGEQLTDDKNDHSITNIALFGVDEREGETAFRSDAIMVLTVDKQNNKLKLSTVMRDSYVPIEGHGKDKIAHAYFYGGPELAVKTLNQNFGLNIREYATVNFNQMAQIVDSVGGVDIELSEEERKDANRSIWEQSEVAGLSPDYIGSAGLQTLNGTQAVAYARIRYVGNADFQRTSRQREVLRKIFEKVKKMNPLDYPGFAKKLLPCIETSLSIGEIMDLGGIMLRDVTFEEMRFPDSRDLIGKDGTIRVNGTDYLNLDIELTKEHMHQFIFDDEDPFAERNESGYSSDGNSQRGSKPDSSNKITQSAG